MCVMNKIDVSLSQSNSKLKKGRREQQQRKTDQNCHYTTNCRTLRHNLCMPKPNASNKRTIWQQLHKTSANMTMMSLSWQTSRTLRVRHDCLPPFMAGGQSCLAQYINTIKPKTFLTGRDDNCRICQAGRLTLNATRNNGRSYRWCLRNNRHTREKYSYQAKNTVQSWSFILRSAKQCSTTAYSSIFQLLFEMSGYPPISA